MIQVINGEIKQYSLPKTGILKDGSTVSGYHLLDEDTLRDEGWLPLEDIKPDYDIETQYLMNDGYEILEDKVIKKYSIVDIREPQLSEIEPSPEDAPVTRQEYEELKPTKIDLLNDRIQELETTVDTILGVDDIE